MHVFRILEYLRHMATGLEGILAWFLRHGVPTLLRPQLQPVTQHIHCPSAMDDSYRDVTAGPGACATSVNNLCASKCLQLNTKKTEVMCFGSVTNLRKILSVDKDILVGSDIISPSVLSVISPPAGTGDNGSSSLRIRFVATGLLQCSSGWATGINTHTTATQWCTQQLDLYGAFHQEITWHQHSDLSIGRG